MRGDNDVRYQRRRDDYGEDQPDVQPTLVKRPCANCGKPAFEKLCAACGDNTWGKP